MTDREIALQQIELQEEMNRNGLNLVTCGNCGTVLIHRSKDEIIHCFCGEIDTDDCPDIWYNGVQNNAEFDDNMVQDDEVFNDKRAKVNEKMESLVMQRLTRQELQDKLNDIFKVEISEIVEATKDDNDTSDNSLLFECKDNSELYGFFDIYYLPTNEPDKIYITEVNCDFEG